MHVTLTKELHDFVDEELKEGHFSAANEMIIEGLYLLEERQSKFEKLRLLINEGKNSELLDGEEAMQRIKSKIFRA